MKLSPFIPLVFVALPVACTDSSSESDAGPRDVPVVTDVPPLPPYNDPFACAPANGSLPLDEPLDATQTRAGVVTNERELIGGEAAAGRTGHLKIYNNHVRFIIQGRVTGNGAGRAVGYSLHGGNLIDADRTRARDAPGQDLFRETFPVFGYRVSGVDEVSVACDGSNGRPAAIRVIGRDTTTRILGILDTIARERNVRMVTHYILRPNSDVLEIRTEVQSLLGVFLPASAAGEFLGFGSALTLFTDATGFGDASRATMPLGFLAGVSDPGEGERNVSYAVAPAEGSMSVPVIDASGTVGLYNNVSAPAGMPASYTRYFSVGDGDVTSAVEALLRARRTPYGVVTGRSASRALVYAYNEPYAPRAVVRSVARAQADGSFRLALVPGRYALVATDEGRLRGAPVAVAVENGAESSASPMPGATGTLVLDLGVTETAGGTRERAPVKVSLRGVDVEAPDSAMGEIEGESESFGLHRAIFSRTGTERFAIKPGRYRALISRGEEYDTAEVEVSVPAAGEGTLRADLRRTLDTRGLISADFHQHTVGSIDASRSLCGRVLENVAEGLEYAATTDHDNVTDFMPCTRELGLTRWFNAIRGNEISVVGVGHFNAYPLTIDANDPSALVGAQYWADTETQALFDRIRAERGSPILHVSHPRSNGLKGYFTYLALDPTTLASRTPLARGWEAIEVNDQTGSPEEFLASAEATVRMRAMTQPQSLPTMHDWFALVARGEHTCALGNSDTHGRNNGSGWPHNLLHVGTDQPAMVTEAMVTEAIRAQRVTVASGIVVRARVGGQERMGWRDVIASNNQPVDLAVEVQAPAWVNARTLAIFENGRPLALTPDGRGGYDARVATDATGITVPLDMTAPGRDGVVRLRATVHLRPTRDSFYVLVARGGSLAPVGTGDAFGYTNPIYIDVDGGMWEPPR